MAEFNCKIFICFVIQPRNELIEKCKKEGEVGRSFKRFERLLWRLRSLALLSGAVIQQGYFSVNINTVNQSSKLTLEESLLASPKRCHDGAALGWAFEGRGAVGTVMMIMSKPQNYFNALLSTTFYDFHFLS